METGSHSSRSAGATAISSPAFSAKVVGSKREDEGGRSNCRDVSIAGPVPSEIGSVADEAAGATEVTDGKLKTEAVGSCSFEKSSPGGASQKRCSSANDSSACSDFGFGRGAD